jgi:hypothetical protein
MEPTMTDPRAFLAAVMAARDTLPHGQRPTDLHVRVAAKLAYWRSPDPRQRSLARAARCSVRSVQRALARLHELGLLTWTRRVVRCSGWRAQVANSYRLTLSPEPLLFLPIRIQSSAKLSPPGRAAPAASPSLAAITAAREAKLQEVWSARRRAGSECQRV